MGEGLLLRPSFSSLCTISWGKNGTTSEPGARHLRSDPSDLGDDLSEVNVSPWTHSEENSKKHTTLLYLIVTMMKLIKHVQANPRPASRRVSGLHEAV